jgi:uncharacterized membrane protein YgdD (TMEM256/DUF423 family)
MNEVRKNQENTPVAIHRLWGWVWGVFGASAVVLGAMGAHGKWHEVLVAQGMIDRWRTAVFYHIVHVLAGCLTLLRANQQARAARWAFLAGILCFSGSLYGMSVAAIKWLGPITPLGGLGLVAGWLLLGWSLSRRA